MSHADLKDSYLRLTERLNRFPQGAPPSEMLFKIFKILFDEKEASLLSLLPLRPFTAERASRAWKMKPPEARTILNALASKGILLDMEDGGRQKYVLPPPMAGFFEFSLMRVRSDIDQKLLSELYYQYINVEEDFIRQLFANGETQMGRMLVHEPVLQAQNELHVLDYERASHIIRTASHIGIADCYCRHKMSHLGRACSAPMNICMTFNDVASSLIKHGIVRPVDAAECLELLDRACRSRLVQFGENVREKVNFICNCCKCCCEAMQAAQRFGMLRPVHTTNLLARVDEERCVGCGKCANTCPVNAVELLDFESPADGNPENRENEKAKPRAKVDDKLCLGCGLCATVCGRKAMRMREREQRVVTPLNSVHKSVVMAIERGKLQNLIFDNQAFPIHRAMAAILGVILRLPPLKQALASRQMKSVYLDALIDRCRKLIPFC
jgi:formate hydrogenlyase subunit 6/NADH:ubiquinone oxidoreductase subunit I